jgi:Phosphotransferase enzyme family
VAGEEEVPLGGAITDAVRVGQTVRRPAGPQDAGVAGLLDHLVAVGFAGAPRYLGRDESGRSVLSWIDGWCPGPAEAYLVDLEAVREVGELLRAYHDAVVDYRPVSPGFLEGPRELSPGQVVCHGDIAPRNTVFVAGKPVAFIDWDGAWISDPLWDVGYAIWQFAPLDSDEWVRAAGWSDMPDRLGRAVALVDGYRLDRAGREALPARIPPMIQQCTDGVVALVEAGNPPFVRLAEQGVIGGMREAAQLAADQESALLDRLLAG